MPNISGLTLSALLLAACLSASAVTPERETQSFSGVVLESQNVDIYTYVRLKVAEGEIWAAVPKASMKVGSRITIGNAMTMQDFESKTLKKHFDRNVFGQLVGTDGKVQSPKTLSAPPAATISHVPKAAGADGRTVAEVVANRISLKGKTVLVRGQVVKANLGIMGKNWLHLQDGSGQGSNGSNDMLVTSKDVATVGDIVTARCTVRTDVNLGSGYNYSVLIEDAAVSK
jgi:hypothetical protein